MSDRTLTLDELQSSDGAIISDGTFKNYRATLNKVNEHFGWDQDVIHYDKMNGMAKEIAEFIKQKWDIKNYDTLKQKLSGLSSLMTRTGFGRDHCISTLRHNADKHVLVETKLKVQNIPEWTKLQKELAEHAAGNQNSVTGIIAKIFSYGYVLRVKEIFETTLVDDGIHNFLDLDKHKWLIRNQKNKRIKEFPVPAAMCSGFSGKWLLKKANGEPYKRTARTLKYHGWTLPNNHDIRKSYETWNCHDSGRNEDERKLWHYILGHSPNTVKAYYDQQALVPVPAPVVKKVTIKTGRPVRTKVPKDVEVVEIAKIKPIIKKRF